VVNALYPERFSTAEIDRLAKAAREQKLALHELQGGTFTITNGGVFGSLLSTPIVNAPQSAILGMHKTQERPMVVNGQIVARPMMYLAVTYDHRIIQGAESGAFLGKLAELLLGEDSFYDAIFRDLKIPYMPVRWQTDQQIAPTRYAPVNADVAKEAAVIQIINAYRIRGHLLANTNPLGSDPASHAELDPASAEPIIEWKSSGHDGGDMAFGPDGGLYITNNGTSPVAVNTGQGAKAFVGA